MKFVRTKKLVMFNNKGGVGKTTLLYNMANKFAEMGFKTVMIDLDPQCNLSKLALGDYFEQNLSSDTFPSINTVLSGIVTGGIDVVTKTKFHKLTDNLSILPGSFKLVNYENLLINAYNMAATGQELGYFVTSAINRFLYQKSLDEEVDIFIIDTSPSLGLLNRVVFLGADYFITPLMPDAFSVQGIENLGQIFENWRDNWKNTGKYMSNNVPANRVLNAEAIYIGYIINSYNQYAKKPIKSHRNWMEKIPEIVKDYLSLRHSKNGLVEKSWIEPLTIIKDYGELTADSQEHSKAIFNLNPDLNECTNVVGTKENLKVANEQFTELCEKVIEILKKY